jgi:serine/threonine-protein kinase HipA
MTELDIVIEGELIGGIRADKSGRLTLNYDSRWRDSPRGHSLSVSLPLADIIYPHKPVWSYLWNLLPENSNVLQRWGQQYHVSAANPFSFLAYVGADVPGAAQFFTPERLDEIRGQKHPTIDWMTLDELAQRLRQLRDDVAAMRRPGDIGKMSLPGAQAKTAYCWDERTRRWGIPGGRAATTHIIKPCVPGFAGLVENEHFCQDIAARLGVPAAQSSVLALDQTYIVIDRYDRLPPEPGSPFVQRVHQEDLCQALALMPGKKYQQDGGPGIAQIVTLIRRVSIDPATDVDRFLDANMFNWLIGGTDAHAKNYSLLIGAGNQVRLAPLYDLSSQLPYPELIEQRVAMKIGDRYEIPLIDLTDWRKLAAACTMDEERMLSRLSQMADALPDTIAAAREQALIDGLDRKILASLATQLTRHVKERRAKLTSASPSRRRTRKAVN